MDITATGPMPNGKPENALTPVSGRSLVATGPVTIEGEYTEVTEKKGFLRRLFGHVTKKEVIKDIAAGAGITLAVRWGSIFVLGGVGLTGLPLIATSAVAASVARTAWTIHKDRKAHALETGEKMSFWEWATRVDTKKGEDGQDIVVDNKRKYMVSLGVSTAGAALGSYAVTDLMPRATEYLAPAMEKLRTFAAPLTEKISNSNVLSTAFGFVAGLFGGGAKPDAVLTAGPVAEATPAKPEVSLKGWNELIGNGPRELPSYVQEILQPPTQPQTNIVEDAVQKRIDQAHALTAQNDSLARRIEDAQGLTAQNNVVEQPAPAAQVPVEATPAPAIIPVGDRISTLADNSNLNRRWTSIVENAVAGNAQAQKDVAMAVLNGTNGFTKNPAEALEIYRAAAEAGNMQAKVDLAYIEFHGLAGVDANPQKSLETLREYAGNNKYARSMLRDLEAYQVNPAGTARSALAAAATPTSGSADPLGDLIASLPADAPVAPAAVPNGATLQVTWSQNADGTIEGIVENPPAWLKPGMEVEVPMVQMR